MTWGQFFADFGGQVLAFIGVAVAVIFSGIGSSRGVGLVGESAAALVKDQPEKFGQSLVLQLLPGTQGLYGFVVGFMILAQITPEMTIGTGALLMLAGFPIGIVGWWSAIYQGRVSAAGLQILAKRPENYANGIIYAVMVETYAILALAVSVLMILNV